MTQCVLRQADARNLPLRTGCISLFTFSPPYSLDMAYADDGSGDIAPDNWVDFLEQVAAELHRVGAPNARLAINVPLDATKGGCRPLYADAVQAFSWKWSYRWTIMWEEGNISRQTARGSLDSANAPHVIYPGECIAVFHKGDWNRDRRGEKTMTREEWLEYTRGVWRVPGESRPWEGFPAAYPLEIPRRLIKLLSLPGDVVCDPFLGSGTSAIAALESGRPFVGLDIFQEQVDMSERRIAAYLKAQRVREVTTAWRNGDAAEQHETFEWLKEAQVI